MKVMLRNENTGQIKQAKLGFSWTVFFFGFFPAIFRGDWKWFLIILIASAFTFGFSALFITKYTLMSYYLKIIKRLTNIVFPLYSKRTS